MMSPCRLPTAVDSNPASPANDEYHFLPPGMPRLSDGGRLPPTSMPLMKTEQAFVEAVGQGK